MKRLFTIILIFVLCMSMFTGVTVFADTETVSVDKEALLSGLYEADIASIREALSLCLVTCEELTAYYLDRIAQYDKPYNCFITICDDALQVAKERDSAIARGEGGGPFVWRTGCH